MILKRNIHVKHNKIDSFLQFYQEKIENKLSEVSIGENFLYINRFFWFHFFKLKKWKHRLFFREEFKKFYFNVLVAFSVHSLYVNECKLRLKLERPFFHCQGASYIDHVDGCWSIRHDWYTNYQIYQANKTMFHTFNSN